MRKQREPTYKKWACPKCNSTYNSPIGLTAVACPQPYHGTERQPVAMKPVTA